MFNIEDKCGDLVELLNQDPGLMVAFGKPGKDGGQPGVIEQAELLHEDVVTVCDALKGMFWEMEDRKHCDIPVAFRFIDNIDTLDEAALVVVEALLDDLLSGFQGAIQDLTRYDRVERD